MGITLESISNAKRVRAPRIILLGTSGIGKSEFSAGADSPVFIPIEGEEGIDALDVQAFPVCETYESLMESIGVLYSSDHEFRSLAIDSASTFAALVDQAALESEGVASKGLLGGGWGHQYDTIVNMWRGVMTGLDALRNDKGMTIIIIGHVKITKSREPDTESYDQYAFDIDNKVAEALIRWSDCTLFMDRKVIVKKEEVAFGKKEKRGVSMPGNQRYLFSQKSATHPGKARGFFGELPAEIALPRHGAWDAFMAHVAEAITK